jgi:purine-nucleoside phosphorylase
VVSTVPGHAGKLVVGELNKKRVALMAGRFHMYEGHSGREATLPIRVLAQAGVKQLIVTSASGALNPKYEVGDFVVLSDLITVFASVDNPLKGTEFADLSEVFDPEMRQLAKKVLLEQNNQFREGVYVYLHGPNYETPADKMLLASLGADVVGMSTVPETMTARWLGIKVLGLSMVTNLAFVKHAHQDVLAAAEAASEKMVGVLTGVAEGLV